MVIEQENLTDRVANVLQHRIQQGVYAVGSKLPAGRLLAGEFQVSAAVIREATERLRTKGLVRSRQGAGCVVLASAPASGFQIPLAQGADPLPLRHIYELRLNIEGGAAALAALRAGKDDIRQMEQCLKELKKTLRVPQQALEWDLKFHQHLAAATHNPYYTRLLQYLNDQWRHSVAVARQHTLATEQAGMHAFVGAKVENGSRAASLSEQVHQEHVDVLKAIKRGDPEAARHFAQVHLGNAGARLGIL
jgi:DNA-binding FadR family transcriptional regulator